jgi:hypothetical protein
MENQFAKLFNFPTGQLLVTMEMHEFDDHLVLKTTTKRDGIYLSTESRVDNDTQTRADFESFEHETAYEQFEGMQRMLAKG